MSEISAALQEAGELLAIVVALALAAVGLVCRGHQSESEEDPGITRERRLEQEEDTRDQGPM